MEGTTILFYCSCAAANSHFGSIHFSRNWIFFQPTHGNTPCWIWSSKKWCAIFVGSWSNAHFQKVLPLHCHCNDDGLTWIWISSELEAVSGGSPAWRWMNVCAVRRTDVNQEDPSSSTGFWWTSEIPWCLSLSLPVMPWLNAKFQPPSVVRRAWPARVWQRRAKLLDRPTPQDVEETKWSSSSKIRTRLKGVSRSLYILCTNHAFIE